MLVALMRCKERDMQVGSLLVNKDQKVSLIEGSNPRPGKKNKPVPPFALRRVNRLE